MWGQCFIEKFCYFLPYSVMVFYYEQRFGRMSYFMNLVIGASQLQLHDAHAGSPLPLPGSGYFAELIRIPFNYPCATPPRTPLPRPRPLRVARLRPPALHALVCVALGLGAPQACWNRAESRAACASSIEVISTFGQTNPDLTSGMLETCRIVYRTQGGLPAFWRGMSGYIMVAARPAISQVGPSF